jgi:hypothetical protein
MVNLLPNGHRAGSPHPVVKKDQVPAQLFCVSEQSCYPVSLGWKIMNQLIAKVVRLRGQQVVMMRALIAMDPVEPATTRSILAQKRVYPVGKASSAKLV